MVKVELLIEKLNLSKHPEGGFYSENYRSGVSIPGNIIAKNYDGNRCLGTSIYFLLNGKDISHFHKLKSDEIWYHHLGSNIIIHMISLDGNYRKEILGANTDKSLFSVLIPKDTWFAAELEDHTTYGLVSCVVFPGFEFQDFELATKDNLITQYPEFSYLINKFT